MTDTRPVLVAYSSGTGNTEAVARAIAGSIPGSVLRKASEAGDLSAYRLVLLGFWIDMGVMSADAKAVMSSASGTPLALFGTMGGDPTSPRFQSFLERVRGEAAASGADLLGIRMWRGRVSDDVVRMMQEAGMMTPEVEARLKASASHPDQTDLSEAGAWAAGILSTQRTPIPD